MRSSKWLVLRRSVNMKLVAPTICRRAAPTSRRSIIRATAGSPISGITVEPTISRRRSIRNRKSRAERHSIVDVTDPRSRNTCVTFPGRGKIRDRRAQMVRICDGKALPKGDRNAVYMLRTFGGEAHEI